ncbi:MAG: hypothetical protein ABEN55_08805, partial [Bradymonadaceae bacterium]
MDTARAERLLDDSLSELVDPDHWYVEDRGGHLWLMLPAAALGEIDEQTPPAASLLLGRRRRDAMDSERISAYVKALGRYLADIADRLDTLGLWADPQRILGEPKLRTEEEFYNRLHERSWTEPTRDELTAVDALLGLLTSADDPPGYEADWTQVDLEVPDNYRTLLETWGPRSFDGWKLYPTDAIAERTERFASRVPDRLTDIWSAEHRFVPVANCGDWEIVMCAPPDTAPDEWFAINPSTDVFEPLYDGMVPAMLAQMTRIDPIDRLPRLQPRVLPTG